MELTLCRQLLPPQKITFEPAPLVCNYNKLVASIEGFEQVVDELQTTDTYSELGSALASGSAYHARCVVFAICVCVCVCVGCWCCSHRLRLCTSHNINSLLTCRSHRRVVNSKRVARLPVVPR